MTRIMDIILYPHDGSQGCKVEVWDCHDSLKVKLVSRRTDEILEETKLELSELGSWCESRVDY